MSERPDDRHRPRPPLLHRASRRQLLAVDLGIAAFLLVALGGHLAVGHHAVAVAAPSFAGAAQAVAVRRRAPFVALGLMAVVAAAALAGGEAAVGLPLLGFPMYSVASTTTRRRALAALAVTGAVVLVGGAVADVRHSSGSGAAFGVVVAVAAWFVGDSVRVRRVYTAGLAEQAAQRQREALERAQRSVAEERLQIARELHDVVAHSLSVIAVQSGVGRHVIDANPGEAKRALAAVEATSRSALNELRHMLGVLRRDDGQPASLAPAPGVGRLEELAAQVRAAGIPVSLRVQPAAVAALSPGAELSVFRVVQEALTNVVKHAGPASAWVEVRAEAGMLVVEVSDDGLGDAFAAVPTGPADIGRPAGAAGHHGIVGMRERAGLFGGTLAAGPRPEGGFRVVARLPIDRVGP